MISDHEELLLQVRDLNSRAYLRDATRAYGVGAYRAALLATWVAVAYDLIAKIRELAAASDPEATAQVEALDKWIASHDIPPMQRFESDLLKLAHEKFQLFSARDLLDLKRLYEDRHYCAHPSFASPGELYSPSGELVRTHIATAVRVVLSQEARQGRAALGELRHAILQRSFPQEREKVEAFLSSGYLARARPTLIGQTVAVVLKWLLRGEDADLLPHSQSLATIFGVLMVRHPAEVEQKVAEQLPRILVNADDAAIWRLYWILAEDPRAYGWAGRPAGIRLLELTRSWTGKAAAVPLFAALSVPDLRVALQAVFRAGDLELRLRLFSSCADPEFFDEVIEAFGAAPGWRTAEARGQMVLPALAESDQLTAARVRRVIELAGSNDKIWDAGGFPQIFLSFFCDTARLHDATVGAWVSFLEARGARDPNRRKFWSYQALETAMTERKMWTPALVEPGSIDE